MEMFQWIATMFHALVEALINMLTSTPLPVNSGEGHDVLTSVFTEATMIASWFGVI